MIKTIAIGTLGRDAELKQSQAGKPYCKFSIAINKKVKGEKVTIWMNCLLFGNAGASLHQYLVKGSKVFVEGEPEIKTYQDKMGNVKIDLSMIVQMIDLIGDKRQEKAESMAQFMNDLAQDSHDDIPF